MADRPDAAFEAFVAREHDDLLRLAVLLTGDRDDAVDLTRGALAAVRARWRRLGAADPGAVARRTLVRRATGRRADDGPRTSGWVADPDPAWGADEHDDVRRTLADLPATARAGVVLTVWGDRPDDEVAEVLSRPVEQVREEVAAAVTRLSRAQVPLPTSWWPAAPPPAADPREHVRLALAALAEADLPPAADPDDAADAARRTVSARRRRGWLAAVAAACAAAVVAVPALTGTGPAAPPPSADREDEPDVRPIPYVDLSREPVRGSLADDEEFVEEVLTRPWVNEQANEELLGITTSEVTRRVFFAGDVPGGRWALVGGNPVPATPADAGAGGPAVTDELAMAWFTGPPGAGAAEMTMASWPFPPMSSSAPAFLEPATGTLVVVAQPGDTVEVSERVEIGDDGSGTRVWEPVEVDDGVAVAALDPVDLSWNWSISYRVLRDGIQIAHGVPDSPIVHPDQADLDLDVAYPDGPPTEQERVAAQQAATTALVTAAVAPRDARLTAHLLRTVSEPVPGVVAVVTAELPGGAVAVSTHFTQEVPGRGSIPMGCGLDVRPAGDPPLGERVMAAVCDVLDPQSGVVYAGILVVTAPPSVPAVRTYIMGDELAAEHDITDGVLVVETVPGTLEVEALTAAGVQLGRTRVLGNWTPSD